MKFESILFTRAQARQGADEAPDFFADLNLDQVIAGVTTGKQDYNLKPFFYSVLQDVDEIYYRQEVGQDLESDAVLDIIDSFAGKMVLVRRYLAMIEKLYYAYNKQGWFLEAVVNYCDAVKALAGDLSRADLKSRGLRAFRDYITEYAASERFTGLEAETNHVKAALGDIRYAIIIRGNRVLVRRYENEIDYSTEVEQTFERFKQGAVKDYRVDLRFSSGMNHIEAQILDCIASLFPETFLELENYCRKHVGFLDETIATFDREIQFYVAYLRYAGRLQRAGLQFCYPQIAAHDKDIFDTEGFDLALASKRIGEGAQVVTNDFYLQGKERIFVVSGPNQGGKTTFARTFGQLHYFACLGLPVPGREARLFLFDQLHYFACLGLPVPGREARLFLFDRIFTHFEREEDITNLRGKLKDDLVRIHTILEQATPDSIVIMNEIFNSTTLQDAVFLSKKILEQVHDLDALGVFVTFIDELASMSEKTVSMVSTVAPQNPAQRTFKVVRKPADGLAYALSIAEKHRLTYKDLVERIEA